MCRLVFKHFTVENVCIVLDLITEDGRLRVTTASVSRQRVYKEIGERVSFGQERMKQSIIIWKILRNKVQE